MARPAKSKDPRSRSWIFTLNNPTDEEIEALSVACAHANTEILMACHEIAPDTKTPHIQGMIEMVNGKTLSALKKFLGSPRYHLQRRKASVRRAWAYACKGEQSKTEWNASGEHGQNWGLNRVILCEIGCPAEEEVEAGGVWACIVEMVKAGASYLEIVDAYPSEAVRMGSSIQRYMLDWSNSNTGWRDVSTTYVGGVTGVGKTRSIMEAYGYQNVYRVTDYAHPFDAYNGEPVLVFEEARFGRKPAIPIGQMLNYLDGYPVRLPCRYADRMAQFTRVFIVSNWGFTEQYPWIQEDYPETYAAFCRRLMHPETGCVDIVDLQSPEDAQRFYARLLAEQNQDEEE